MKRGKIILIAAIASVIIAGGSLIYITVNDRENDVSHLEASTVVSIDNTTQSEEIKKTEEENTKKEDNKIKEANEADKKKTENKAASAGKITGSMVNADGTSREETSADKEENTQIKPEQAAEQKVQTTEATTQESYTESDTTETVNAECNHNWVEQTKEVSIPEKGHNEKVCVEAAWDEPIEEEHKFCYCGFDITAAGTDTETHQNSSACTNDGGWYTQWVTVGTVHHDAVYEEQWVVDEAAHTETQVTGYKCSKCGATK